MRRALAWLNLAYRFGIHLLRLPLRPLRRGRDAERFLAAVLPEGYVPLTPEEREIYPRFMDCLNCGLCTLACPVLRESPASAWAEPWTFVAGGSRSIDRPALLAAPPCTRCDECRAVCPSGVPIPALAAAAERIAGAAAERAG